MEKKASITFTTDELSYLIRSLELHEFNNPEDHDQEEKKFMKTLCMKFIKGLHRTGYTTATSVGLERFLKENY